MASSPVACRHWDHGVWEKNETLPMLVESCASGKNRYVYAVIPLPCGAAGGGAQPGARHVRNSGCLPARQGRHAATLPYSQGTACPPRRAAEMPSPGMAICAHSPHRDASAPVRGPVLLNTRFSGRFRRNSGSVLRRGHA